MQGCSEVKKLIGVVEEEEVRKTVDCRVTKVDLVLTRAEFEVIYYLHLTQRRDYTQSNTKFKEYYDPEYESF